MADQITVLLIVGGLLVIFIDILWLRYQLRKIERKLDELERAATLINPDR